MLFFGMFLIPWNEREREREREREERERENSKTLFYKDVV